MLPQAVAASKWFIAPEPLRPGAALDRWVARGSRPSRIVGVDNLLSKGDAAGMSGEVSRNLARNIRAAREVHGLSQQQMANLSGVPRPTWANLESGDANPTVSVLTRVAGALKVSLEQLLSPPQNAGLLTRRKDLVSSRKGKAIIRQLLPEAARGAVLERLELRPGGHLASEPHAPGTREHFVCECGQVTVEILDESWTLQRGDVLAFAADQRHTYRAVGDETACGYSLVMLP